MTNLLKAEHKFDWALQLYQGLLFDKNCRYSGKCRIYQNRTNHLERKTSQVPYYKVLETHEHDTNNENSYLANCI